MSYCKRDGKDKSVFLTKEDLNSSEMVSELVEGDQHGIILPNGEINWDCPCLGGMAYGSCGKEFKDAFSCFHHSQEEEKGVDCIPQFKGMQECFMKYPEEYGKFTEDEDDEKRESDKAASDTKTKAIIDSGSELENNSKSGTELIAKSNSGSKLETSKK